MEALSKGISDEKKGDPNPDPALEYSRQYVGGLAYLMMHYAERYEHGERGVVPVHGIHGPSVEALIKLTAGKKDGVDVTMLDDSMMHTSESVLTEIRKDTSGKIFYCITYTDPSKHSLPGHIKLDMESLRKLAVDFRDKYHKEEFERAPRVPGREFGALPKVEEV